MTSKIRDLLRERSVLLIDLSTSTFLELVDLKAEEKMGFGRTWEWNHMKAGEVNPENHLDRLNFSVCDKKMLIRRSSHFFDI